MNHQFFAGKYFFGNHNRFSPQSILLSTFLLSTMFLTACSYIPKTATNLWSGGGGGVVLRLHGSNTIGAKFAPELIKAFLDQKGATNYKLVPGAANEMMIEAVFPGDSAPKRIEIRAHGSDTGVKGLGDGACDVAMLSRKMKSDEAEQLSKLGDMSSRNNENVIALDGIAIIVNKNNKIRELSLKQIAGIFTGEIDDWSKVKSDGETGNAGKITVYARNSESGTFDTFKNLVLGKEKKLIAAAKPFEDSKLLSSEVENDPNGIGFVGLPYIGNTNAVAVYEEGVQPLLPKQVTIQTKEYLLHRELYLYVPQTSSALVREFIAFVLSKDGQTIAKKVGFVPNFDEKVIDEPKELTSKARKEMPAELAKIKDSATDTYIRLYFKSGGKQLDNSSLNNLDSILNLLEDKNAKEVILVGYSDSDGDEAQNLKLSVERAAAVEKEFLKASIKPTVTGFGEANPIRPNETKEGKEKNRRVEVYYR